MKPLIAAITDRRGLTGGLIDNVRALLDAGIDLLQLREKDLEARELYDLARAIRSLPNPSGAKLVVNARADVALAAGFDGVHLPADSPSPELFRRISERFVIGVSCHSADEAVRAAEEGADYVVFGPVFETASKRAFGPPQGLARLEEVCRAANIPVLALGGITESNAGDCLRAGAAGLAGISIFQRGRGLRELVERLRAAGEGVE